MIHLATNKALAHCKKCSNTYQHPRTKPDRNNSDLHKHFNTHIRKIQKEKSQIQQRNTLDTYLNLHPNVQFRSIDTGITTSQLNTLLLNTGAACNWPFDLFDNAQFRGLIHRGFPGHTCPHRKAMANLLKKAADTARREIKERFESVDSRISLALDCWTSSNHWEFMGTSHSVVAG